VGDIVLTDIGRFNKKRRMSCSKEKRVSWRDREREREKERKKKKKKTGGREK
jgi:hypothetical protein